MKSEDWATLSNAFAMCASIPAVILMNKYYVFIQSKSEVLDFKYSITAFLILIFFAYLSAMKIEGCLIPLRRALLIFFIFSTVLLGFVLPVDVLFEIGYNKIILYYIACSLVFAIMGFLLRWSLKSYEDKST